MQRFLRRVVLLSICSAVSVGLASVFIVLRIEQLNTPNIEFDIVMLLIVFSIWVVSLLCVNLNKMFLHEISLIVFTYILVSVNRVAPDLVNVWPPLNHIWVLFIGVTCIGFALSRHNVHPLTAALGCYLSLLAVNWLEVAVVTKSWLWVLLSAAILLLAILNFVTLLDRGNDSSQEVGHNDNEGDLREN